MSKRDKKRQQFEERYGEEAGFNPAPYSQTASNEWLAAYEGGAVEFFYRDPSGMIRGAGPRSTVDAAGGALFRARVLDNRPPLHAGASQAVRDFYEQGYFVVPAAIEVSP